jgi:PKD repeat protein
MLDSSSISYPYYSGLFDAPVDDANCKSDFSWRVDVADPQLVFFTDISDPTVSSWYWIFGDGETSTERNPIHQYSRPGTYPVILATSDKSGFCNNTTAYQVKVGSLSCNAEFTAQVDTLGNSISLDNASQGTGLSYFWNFGDGAVSNEINPTHQYDYPGAYPVTLTVRSADGSCVDRYFQMIRTGTVTCNTDFVVSVEPETNSVYLRVTEPNPQNSYLWILGDGTLAKDPSLFHTFSNPGEYSVSLSVSNLQNGCVETRREILQVGDKSPGGKAKFIYVSGDDNLVSFTNHSIGDGLSYVWDFNDGSDLSTEKDPVHKYVIPGYYDVCLSVLNREGTVDNTYCEKIFAGTDASKECLAQFEYILSGTNDSRIRCLDRSFGNPDEWRWRYSTDGWIDRKQNTSWTAKGASYVVIQQTIKNSTTGCRDDRFALVNMGAEAAVKAGFGYVVDSSGTKANTYPVDFVGISLGDAGKLKWDFGDGTFDSTSVNPVHVYEQPGVYKVCLTVINTTTGEEDTSCEMVEVGSVSSNRSFEAEDMVLKSYPNPFSSDTQVEIRLTRETRIYLALYDLMGRKLRTLADEYRTSGTHTLRLDGSDLESGNYHLVLTTGSGQVRTTISIIR